jgi:hypothetical protein
MVLKTWVSKVRTVKIDSFLSSLGEKKEEGEKERKKETKSNRVEEFNRQPKSEITSGDC